jgi:hypothetical protein
MDDAITVYFQPRDGTKKWMNDCHISKILKSIKIVKGRWEGSDRPCMLWIKPLPARMNIHKDKVYLANFLYDYCIGELGEKCRTVQMCPKDGVCIQPYHITTKKRKIESISNTPFETPDEELLKETEKSGKVLVDEQGRIFMTKENYLKLMAQLESGTVK